MKQNRRRKYGNTKIETSEGTFDSKAEYGRYRELILLEKAGEIQKLKRQKKFVLLPKQGDERAVTYIADFVYVEGNKTIVEDVKSVATARDKTYILKRKLFKHKNSDIEFREILR